MSAASQQSSSSQPCSSSSQGSLSANPYHSHASSVSSTSSQNCHSASMCSNPGKSAPSKPSKSSCSCSSCPDASPNTSDTTEDSSKELGLSLSTSANLCKICHLIIFIFSIRFCLRENLGKLLRLLLREAHLNKNSGRFQVIIECLKVDLQSSFNLALRQLRVLVLRIFRI